LWIWIMIPIKVISWIRIRIKVIRWTLIQIRINLQMTSQNVWNMSLFEHFFKVLSLYLEARIQIRPDPYQSDKQNPESHQSDADPQHCLKLCNKFITNITWVLISAASSQWESHCFTQGTIRTGTGIQIRQLLLLFVIKKNHTSVPYSHPAAYYQYYGSAFTSARNLQSTQNKSSKSPSTRVCSQWESRKMTTLRSWIETFGLNGLGSRVPVHVVFEMYQKYCQILCYFL